MSVEFSPFNQNAFTTNSGNYPIAPTLSSAQAETNPFQYNPLSGADTPFGGPNQTGGTPSFSGMVNAASQAASPVTSFFSLLSPSNLTRLLVIGIGVIFLIVGLVMLGRQNPVQIIQKATG